MRMLITVIFPMEPFNTYVRQGTLLSILNKAVSAIGARNVYFTEVQGKRTMVAEVVVKDPTDLARFGAPFHLAFNALVEAHPAVSLKELGELDLQALAQPWS